MSNIQNSQGGISLSDEALLDAVTLDERHSDANATPCTDTQYC